MKNLAEINNNPTLITEGRGVLEQDLLAIIERMIDDAQLTADTEEDQTEVYTWVSVDGNLHRVIGEGVYQEHGAPIVIRREFEYDGNYDVLYYTDSVWISIDGQAYALKVSHIYPEIEGFEHSVEVVVDDHIGFRHVYRLNDDKGFEHRIFRLDEETRDFIPLPPSEQEELSCYQLGTGEQIGNCMNIIGSFPELNSPDEMDESINSLRDLLQNPPSK